MQLIQYFSDGTLVFNWEQLPEKIRAREDIRDKIFNEIQQKLKVNDQVTSLAILDLNRYVIKRLSTEIKTCIPQKKH